MNYPYCSERRTLVAMVVTTAQLLPRPLIGYDECGKIRDLKKRPWPFLGKGNVVRPIPDDILRKSKNIRQTCAPELSESCSRMEKAKTLSESMFVIGLKYIFRSRPSTLLSYALLAFFRSRSVARPISWSSLLFNYIQFWGMTFWPSWRDMSCAHRRRSVRSWPTYVLCPGKRINHQSY